MKKLFTVTALFSKQLKRNHVDVYSASAAFFMFVSIIPFMIVLLTLIPYTPLTKSDLLSAIEILLPSEMDELGANIIDELYGKSPAILSISAITAVWSASRGILAITKGLNEIAGAQESRNYVVMRIWSAFYTLIMILAVVILLVGGVFGKRIRELVEKYVPNFPVSIKTIFGYRDFIMIGILFLVLLIGYTVLPDKKMRTKKQIPGALLAAVVWWAFSGLFSVYIMHYNAYSMYGSLAAVIIMMLWLYAGMYIVFIGAQINYDLTFREALHKIYGN